MKEMKGLQDKIGIITGGAQGLGRYLTERLAGEGCHLVICDVNEKGAADTKREVESRIDRRIIGVKADVTSEEDVRRMVDTAVHNFARIDFLVSNAGISISGSIHDFDIALWKKTVDVNLFGYFLCAREVSRAMIESKSGSIVQINSRTGKRGSAKNSAYAASKGGGIVLTQSLSQELAKHNIRVNCVCPGPIFESELWQKVLFKDYANRFSLTEEEVKKKYLDEIPLGRECTYEDVADVVVFLISDQSRYMTGQALNITGGTTVW
jgi:sorbitol-6-phosphate 2-dehydrogenase